MGSQGAKPFARDPRGPRRARGVWRQMECQNEKQVALFGVCVKSPESAIRITRREQSADGNQKKNDEVSSPSDR